MSVLRSSARNSNKPFGSMNDPSTPAASGSNVTQVVSPIVVSTSTTSTGPTTIVAGPTAVVVTASIPVIVTATGPTTSAGSDDRTQTSDKADLIPLIGIDNIDQGRSRSREASAIRSVAATIVDDDGNDNRSQDAPAQGNSQGSDNDQDKEKGKEIDDDNESDSSGDTPLVVTAATAAGAPDDDSDSSSSSSGNSSLSSSHSNPFDGDVPNHRGYDNPLPNPHRRSDYPKYPPGLMQSPPVAAVPIGDLEDIFTTLAKAITDRDSTNGDVKGTSVRAPDKFSGKDRTKYRTFIAQLRLVFRANAKRFASDVNKVTYACSYLNDVAFSWYENFVPKDVKPDWFFDFSLFEQELSSQFGTINAPAITERKLGQL